MPDFVELLISISLPVFAIIGSVVTLVGIFHYRTITNVKRIDRLIFSMTNGLIYLRDLHQKDQQGSYPKLYQKLIQEGKELDLLLDKYGSKLDSDRYQQAQHMVHIAAALRPKGNFLTQVADGLLDAVDDLFPEAEKVTTMLRPKTINQLDILYNFEKETTDSSLAKIHYIQQLAPEIVELYSKIEKNQKQIVDRLKTSQLSNKAELLTIHQTNMRHFSDVLDGYLRIKEDPSQYYKSEERLSQAAQTLHRFEQLLAETLRQLNENDMMNFEISLRLLQKEG